MPSPNAGESKKDFISRCISSPEATKTFPDVKQRAAFCYSQWERKGTSEMIMFPIKIGDMQFDEGTNITKEIQVLPVGMWNHPVYGKIKISEKDIDEFVKNFEDNIRKELPITEGHSVGEEEKPAIGWFKQLFNKGRDGLWAIVEWTKEGMNLLSDKAYKYFSPEFYTNYEDPETRKVYQNVLVGGAVTNRPYFKGLKAVVMSELTLYKMATLEEILVKKPEDLTDEEVAELKKATDLTDEQKKTFKAILEEGTAKTEEELKAEAEAKAKAEADAKAKADADAAAAKEEEEKKASEMIQVSKKSMEFLEKQASEGVKALAILRKTENENYVKGLTFSETNKKANFLPKSQNKVVDFLLSLSEAQQEAFKAIVAELPQAELFSELGKDSGIEVKASDQITALTKEKMDKNPKLTYRQAVEQVFAENPNLQKASENK